ncbi:uncharacterized protein PADG_04454 [Paracoccidioides brasiliensis Pb18]|uniref:F-box domain-containing protein n=1 Tax=Paracoccidioides brasiliensis (strain Pb18) TaxID=502780 RepID=C1GB18_PARBD|nr:uncharacterized protein PADG_04454 [Paracoccidioides brasiliensis Pb18]EEH48370.2 hypothetical protein PADG_04454 [Paracoccidioides brasiliensis Pb18]
MAMEDGDSISTWSRLENPASFGPDMIVDTVISPQTPLFGADKPITRSPPIINTTREQSPGSSNDAACRGRDSLGCLPRNIIERILYIVDANSFASLALLNSKWRGVSDLPELYRYHLDGCVGTVLLNKNGVLRPWASEDLWHLKRRFAREARRNLFESFLGAQKTVVNLISASASSASAFPQGEAFRYTFSANGRQLLALSSSRIFVVDLATSPVSVSYELKTLRRPHTATIVDDASLLAVVSTTHQANIYRLLNRDVKLIQSISLDEVPRTISFSPEGTVLAFAYDGGIEVHALGENALATDRRAVRCFATDMLSFSRDGLMLVGSSNDPLETRMVSISPPLYMDLESELPSPEFQSRMWATQILSPDITIGYNNMTLVPSKAADAGVTWIVGYDSQLQVFRLGQLDDTRAGFTYFVGPGGDGEIKEPGPSSEPTASSDGELLVLGFQGSGIWLYGIPDVSGRPSASDMVLERGWGSMLARTNSQRLNKVIKPPSHLVHGRLLSSMTDITGIKWVNTNLKTTENQGLQRLVAVAPGGVRSHFGEVVGDHLPVDGGRIVVFDFARSSADGKAVDITIEVGEAEPTPLPERGSTLDVEVELERRRTRVNRCGGLGRNRNTVIERSMALSRHRASIGNANVEPVVLERAHRNSVSQPGSPTDSILVVDLQAVENPYSNTQPRSQDILSRAATAAAADRGRSRFQNPRYQQSMGSANRRQFAPHESDADNWVPPPPPYTPNADEPLPEHIQRFLLPSATKPIPGVSQEFSPQHRRAQTSRFESMTQNAMERTRSTMERINVPRARLRKSPDTPGVGDLVRDNATSRHSPSSRRTVSDGRSRIISLRESRVGPHHVQPGGGRPGCTTPGPTRAENSESYYLSGPPQRLVINTQIQAPLMDRTPSGLTNASSVETWSARPSIPPGSALQERTENLIPPTVVEYSQSDSTLSRVIGRNGPIHHLDIDRNKLTPSFPTVLHGGIRMGNSGFSTTTQDSIDESVQTTTRNPNLSYTLHERPDNLRAPRLNPRNNESSSRHSAPPKFSPVLTKPHALSTPHLHLQSHGPRRMGEIFNISSNQESQRSRPRSQDVPRHKPMAGGAFFDVRSGRVLSSSQSDAGVGHHPGTEELRERMIDWSQLEREKKKKKDTRCTIM